MNKAVILLEGGAFRTLYTAGVLDVLMKNDIYMDTVGVSGGALMGVNYIAKQAGRSRLMNLAHRHDSRYVGKDALREEHGLIGFRYMLGDTGDDYPFDEGTFFSSPYRFVAVTTCCETGLPVYFDRDACDRDTIFAAMAASSSLPIISRPVAISGNTYMDGGLSIAIPVYWAMEQGYEKIVVIRTRDRSYRKPPESRKEKAMYAAGFSGRPLLLEDVTTVSDRYNRLCEELIELENSGKIFTIAPQDPVHVERLEKDLVKLKKLYDTGWNETEALLPALRRYLEI